MSFLLNSCFQLNKNMIQFKGLEAYAKKNHIIRINSTDEQISVAEGKVGQNFERYTIKSNDYIKQKELSDKIIKNNYSSIKEKLITCTIDLHAESEEEFTDLFLKRDYVDEYIEEKTDDKFIAFWLGAEGIQTLYKVWPFEENIKNFEKIIKEALAKEGIKKYSITYWDPVKDVHYN